MVAITLTREWGAVRPPGCFPRYPAEGILIGGVDVEDGEEPEVWAAQLQQKHIATGLSDTAYHFLVGRDGAVLEGRHGSVAGIRAAQVVRAAHSPGFTSERTFNCSWIGILLQGTVGNSVQIARTAELCAWIMRMVPLSAEQLRTGIDGPWKGMLGITAAITISDLHERVAQILRSNPV